MLSRSPLPPSQAGPSTRITPPNTTQTYTRHQGGAHLCYTPMIHAKVFMDSKGDSRVADQFNLGFDDEGSHEPLAGIEGGDRPLFVQVCPSSVAKQKLIISKFCANDPDILLEAAKKVQHRCDAIDINL